MVRGSYSPPSQVTTGSIQGSDSDGNTGLTVSDGVAGLRADGVQQLKATTSGVTFRMPVASIAAAQSPYSVNVDDSVILVDSSAGEVEISLPSAVTTSNRRYIIKDKGSASTNAVTVSAASGNIDGLNEVSITNSYAYFAVISDGSNYWVID